jgi:hypothetical protein
VSEPLPAEPVEPDYRVLPLRNGLIAVLISRYVSRAREDEIRRALGVPECSRPGLPVPGAVHLDDVVITTLAR